jgi:plasmid stability protein
MSKMIQVRNVPESLHRTLKARAAMSGMSLSDYLLSEFRDIADRPTLKELQQRLETRRPVNLRESASVAVRLERDAR